MFKSLKIPFFTLLFFFIFTFLFFKLFGPIPFFVNGVQTTKTDLFHVDGTGKATAIPNTSLLSFSVTKTANTTTDAQNQTNKTIDAIMTALKNLGIDTKDIKTTNYSVNPQYDTFTNQRVTGYQVTQDLEVNVQPIDKANKAIDAATSNGATNVNAGTFTFDDTTMKNLQQKAREDAVKDAKQKAESLAAAAGIHLGRIVDVQETNNVPEPIRFGALQATSAKSADNQPTNVTPGQNEVTSTITLSYEVY